jgi:DNA mismatch endonuclease, patch repair protein
LTENRARDVRNEQSLAQAGWLVMVVWECELRDKKRLELKLKCFLGEVHEES